MSNLGSRGGPASVICSYELEKGGWDKYKPLAYKQTLKNEGQENSQLNPHPQTPHLYRGQPSPFIHKRTHRIQMLPPRLHGRIILYPKRMRRKRQSQFSPCHGHFISAQGFPCTVGGQGEHTYEGFFGDVVAVLGDVLRHGTDGEEFVGEAKVGVLFGRAVEPVLPGVVAFRMLLLVDFVALWPSICTRDREGLRGVRAGKEHRRVLVHHSSKKNQNETTTTLVEKEKISTHVAPAKMMVYHACGDFITDCMISSLAAFNPAASSDRRNSDHISLMAWSSISCAKSGVPDTQPVLKGSARLTPRRVCRQESEVACCCCCS